MIHILSKRWKTLGYISLSILTCSCVCVYRTIRLKGLNKAEHYSWTVDKGLWVLNWAGPLDAASPRCILMLYLCSVSLFQFEISEGENGHTQYTVKGFVLKKCCSFKWGQTTHNISASNSESILDNDLDNWHCSESFHL